MKQPHKRTALLFITLSMVAVLLLLIDMATGDTYIPISKVWAVLTGGECDEMTRNILLSIRFIRVVVAALIGVALSVSGLQMQTVFQNPLADPYLLGVSSGAGLGVALFILGAPLLGWTEFPVLQSLGIVGSGWVGTAAILLICGRCHHPDTAIPEFCRTTENVHALVNGIIKPHYSHSTRNYDSDAVPGAADFRSLHQTTKSAVTRRELCADHGNEYQALAYLYFHIHRTAHRNGHRLLWPCRFHRTGCSARHPVTV